MAGEKDTVSYFIDIERFVQWTYDNPHLFNFYNGVALCGKTTLMKWRRYDTLPSLALIEEINGNRNSNEAPFEEINIADLLLCVNNAKDHNRGNDVESQKAVNSTGKKVLNLLLLGRTLDGKAENGYFTTYKKGAKQKDIEVWNYLNRLTEDKHNIETFYYLPGRTVSCKQLQQVATRYKNGINPPAILDGLKALQRVELVECVDEKAKLYKLSYNGCKNFLNKNKH